MAVETHQPIRMRIRILFAARQRASFAAAALAALSAAAADWAVVSGDITGPVARFPQISGPNTWPTEGALSTQGVAEPSRCLGSNHVYPGYVLRPSTKSQNEY